jgi:SAM-dependent methyltransferase
LTIEASARQAAQDQWNRIACGELPGDKTTIDYFDAVTADRYRQQPWMHAYFGYERFAGKRVLEIGVGQGTDLTQFANAGAECHGIDITDNHLALTARQFTLRGRSVDLRKADATAIPFPDGYFDGVYSFGVLHHIPEIEAVLAEVNRVLRPGGELMLALYYKWSAFHLFNKLIMDGLGHGWLFSKGYAGLLSTIEHGADGIAVKPYVKLYDKRFGRRLLSGFDVLDVSVHQLHGDHFAWLPPRVMAPFLDCLQHRIGWYLALKATKRISLKSSS